MDIREITIADFDGLMRLYTHLHDHGVPNSYPDVDDRVKDIANAEECYKMMLLTGSKTDSTLRFYENAGYNRNDKTAFIQWL